MKARNELSKVPEPDQLFKIASAVMFLASKYNKIRESSRTDNAHIFLTNELEYLGVVNGQPAVSTRKFTGKVARTDYKRWRMRVLDTMWATSSEETDSFRMEFNFEWTNKEVSTASRRVIMNSKDTIKLEDMSEGQNDELIRAHCEPYFVDCMSQFGEVLADDCDILLKDMRNFNDMSLKCNL